MMEFGVREILIVVVGLIILGIVMDGLRRAYESRKNSLRVDIKKQKARDDDLDDNFFDNYNPELPTGTSRPVKQQKEVGSSVPPALKVSENLDPDTAELVDTDVVVDRIDMPPESETLQIEKGLAPEQEEIPLATERLYVEPLAEDPTPTPVRQLTIDDSATIPPRKRKAVLPPEEVIAINMSCKQNAIAGEDLLKITLNNGLRFGDNGIFHRLDSLADEEGGKLFSMVNMVKPGVFDVDAMAEFSTPGVCLFLTLPGPRAPRRAFETMLETAQRMASALDCDLRDETQSALTRQTIAHYRQRIDEFCRRKMAAEQQLDLVE